VEKSQELGLQSVTIDWKANSNCKAVADVITTGHKKFESSSLATFNKKIANLKQGIPIQMETDEITPCQVIDTMNTDDLELSEENSALHED